MLVHFAVCIASLVASGNGLSLPHVARQDVSVHGPGKLVVFGDSFSDNGTGAWAVTNNTWPADPAYDGHRFSNGPVWVERLADMLRMELHDVAVGGATSNNSATQGSTGPGGSVRVPSMLDQVAWYLDNGAVGSGDLYVILIGGNDGIFQGKVEPVIKAISDVIPRLKSKGATRFLLGTYPDLGDLPYRQFATADTTRQLAAFSKTLQRSLLKLWRTLCNSDVQIGFVDSNRLFKDMMSNPASYGFDPENGVHKSCLVGAYNEAPRTVCSEPDRYIFWDEYHVTRASHQYMANLAFKESRGFCDGKH